MQLILILIKSFFIVILLNCYCFSAVPVRAWVNIDRKEITIGDLITYKVKIEYPLNLKLIQPDFVNLLSSFEIRKQSVKGPQKKGGFFTSEKQTIEYKFVIQSFGLGKQKIPEYKIIFVDPKNPQIPNKELTINEMEINIKGVKKLPTDKDDIRDLKSPLDFFVYTGYFFTFLLLLFGIFDFLFFKYFYLPFLNLHKQQEITQPSKPPYEIAYEELEKLFQSNLLKDGKIKEYYIQLSEIIRIYLNRRFNIPVIERTTEELYNDLRNLNINVPSGVSIPKNWKKIVSIIKDFLDNCDMVKFAKYIPLEKQIENDFNLSKEIINLTSNEIQ